MPRRCTKRRRQTFHPTKSTRWVLPQVAEISAELDKILKTQGYSQGSVGDRLAALNRTPAELYPDTDAGRADLLASLNAGVKDMSTRLSARLRDAA